MPESLPAFLTGCKSRSVFFHPPVLLLRSLASAKMAFGFVLLKHRLDRGREGRRYLTEALGDVLVHR